ncbi:hypothetical protein DPM13_07805 [Paracoccus mutanolyticus]|uniref:Uncharacterized protein n=1 Tax=Paracoccus mutanolyticus TaxID=1499308 RepID=A0ABM6WRC1_9RHOB|nr:hypothetical protein [Paracoccus mutanolyticus]AWX93086.1 hypothetical protein DPM13_07805 [Paracoccus mutanolyticus]
MLTNDELAKWDRENFMHPSTNLAQEYGASHSRRSAHHAGQGAAYTEPLTARCTRSTRATLSVLYLASADLAAGCSWDGSGIPVLHSPI